MNKKKYISVFAGSILLFNGVFVSLNVPNLTTNSIVVAAEDEPPADEEIPDAEQLGYQKQLKKLLDEADGYINDNDHESFDPFFEEEAETLRNLVTSIKDEYKVQKNILINRYNKVLEFAGRSSEKVPLVGGEENKPTPPAMTEVEKEFTETRPIPFETVKQDDATLDKGVEKEKTAGVEGVKTITYKAKFKDNKEVANTRTKVKEEVTKQPVNKVVLVGTKEKTIAPGGTVVTPTPTPDFKPVPREKFSVTPEEGVQNLVEEKPRLEISTEEIPFSVEKRYNNKLEKGVQREIASGENGTRKVFSKVEMIAGKEKRTVVSTEIEKEAKNQILEIGTLDPKTNTTRNEENSKVKDINKDEKTESIKGTSVKDINKDAKIESNKGKLPLTGISQINTFIAGVFTLIIAGVLTIFKRKKR
jgi:LPXTG-motif cell wall anchor domain protein